MKKNKRGFTMVEMVLVVGIIVIMATVLTAGLNAYIDSANRRAARVYSQGDSYDQALMAIKGMCNASPAEMPPPTSDEASSGHATGDGTEAGNSSEGTGGGLGVIDNNTPAETNATEPSTSETEATEATESSEGTEATEPTSGTEATEPSTSETEATEPSTTEPSNGGSGAGGAGGSGAGGSTSAGATGSASVTAGNSWTSNGKYFYNNASFKVSSSNGKPIQKIEITFPSDIKINCKPNADWRYTVTYTDNSAVVTFSRNDASPITEIDVSNLSWESASAASTINPQYTITYAE